jgi:hypothetical protein
MQHPRALRRLLAGTAFSVLALTLAGVASPHEQGTKAAAKLTVTFTDRALQVSMVTPASGLTTFVVVNKGQKRHVLEITGPGVKGAQTAKLAAGTRATITVRLRPGAYVLSDPVGLGVYNVQFLNVVRATAVTGRGNGSVVAPPVVPPPMCGQYFTP